jgi:hypothetical protein
MIRIVFNYQNIHPTPPEPSGITGEGAAWDHASSVQLDDIAVVKLVVTFDHLSIEDAASPDSGELHGMLQVAMDQTCQIVDRAARVKSEGMSAIGRLTWDFGIDANHAE